VNENLKLSMSDIGHLSFSLHCYTSLFNRRVKLLLPPPPLRRWRRATMSRES